MEMDRKNRNCYNYRRFGHLARNCRNKGIRGRIGEGKRLKYSRNNRQSNLNRE